MNILALDIGFSRTGFAIGSTETSLAFPREIIEYAQYKEHLEWYCKDSGENIKKIIIGVPNTLFENTSGETSEHLQKIQQEIKNIQKIAEKYQIQVDTFDEQFTSKIAEQSLYTMGFSAKKQKGKKDAMAAAIILQGYLDRHSLRKFSG